MEVCYTLRKWVLVAQADIYSSKYRSYFAMARFQQAFGALLRKATMRQTLDSIPEQDAQQQRESLPLSHSLDTPMPTKDDKMHYLSNLKAFLIALVILHHTAITYGGSGHVAYRSHPPDSQPLLVTFNAINQTFFMAIFFFIAGFLSRRSLRRRTEKDGPAACAGFVWDRLLRLGVPTAVYSFLGPPMCVAIVTLGRNGDVNWNDVWDSVVGIRGVRGPVWFCALLLVFDALIAICLVLRKIDRGRIMLAENHASQSDREITTLSSWKLLVALSLLTTADFLWRLAFPVGYFFTAMNLNLGYLPQYIAAYTFGVVLPDPQSAIPCSSILIILALTSTASGYTLARSMSNRLDADTALDPTAGGLNVFAAAYAIFNNLTGYLIACGLLRLFHLHIHIAWNAISSLAYTAFLPHIPISTAVEVALAHWQGGPVTKILFVGAANVIASWIGAAIWEKAGSFLWHKTISGPAIGAHSRGAVSRTAGRRRTLSRDEQRMEILEGLDEVG